MHARNRDLRVGHESGQAVDHAKPVPAFPTPQRLAADPQRIYRNRIE